MGKKYLNYASRHRPHEIFFILYKKDNFV